MAVIAICSAKGAPGVTTTALAMALAWPRACLLVEADLAGSSILPGYFRGERAHKQGLGALAIAHRHGDLDEELWSQTVALSTQDTPALLPGLASSTHAPAVRELWGPLTATLGSLERGGVDVLVDLGRVSAIAEERSVVLRTADQVLLATGSRLPDILPTRDLARSLHTVVDEAAGEAFANAALLVVGPGRPYGAKEIAQVVGMPVVGTISYDPVSADVLSVGASRGKRFEASDLVRSCVATVEQVRARVEERRQRLSTSEVA